MSETTELLRKCESLLRRISETAPHNEDRVQASIMGERIRTLRAAQEPKAAPQQPSLRGSAAQGGNVEVDKRARAEKSSLPSNGRQGELGASQSTTSDHSRATTHAAGAAPDSGEMPEEPKFTIPDYPSRSFQKDRGIRTVPWDDWVGMQLRALELREYANLLRTYALSLRENLWERREGASDRAEAMEVWKDRAEAAEALLREKREGKVRRLLASDSWCPTCGHNRDTSSVSSIDNEDGTRSCQLCGVNWVELSAAPSAGGEEKARG